MSRSNNIPYTPPAPRARVPRPEPIGPSFSPKMHDNHLLGKWAEGIPIETLRRWRDNPCQCHVCRKAGEMHLPEKQHSQPRTAQPALKVSVDKV